MKVNLTTAIAGIIFSALLDPRKCSELNRLTGRWAGALVLINQSEPNERSLDSEQGHAVVGGGDHLLSTSAGALSRRSNLAPWH